MPITRRQALAASGLALAARPAAAESFPSRAIRVIVPYAAGGTDQYIRSLQQSFAQALGQPVLIDSVVGGGGGIGANRVRTSAPDGYTLLFAGTAALTIVPRVQNLSYTTADFAPVCNLVSIPIMLAAKRGSRFGSMAEMLAEARAKPESITFGTPGIGSSPHLAGEATARAAGVKLLHVPYPGIAPAMTALLAGDIDLVFGAPGIIMPAVEAHGILPLAQTGGRRIASLPDLVTLREVGLDVDLATRFGFLAPRETPVPILEHLGSVFLRAAASPEYAEAMQRSYNEVLLMDRAQFAQALAEEDQLQARLIQELGIRSQ
ncbi:tripartite tricarboxylate transporter substrate binding protein [Roseomonas marmotae]|uniref:Tripartite tricarboxylate transporter substrate binding protein n=1 Tax=Roseomonas marmotae TaxID=2768161 RepID=A0ABS3KAR4_9PROT|nr:tripartite tricarboxylate transporter substrate binding protein [Roseomonas marmotae]MBO1074539.1 tripartite tricarboxylate transporter substrate binding protein [Roseomonas marmotae]QTI81572.1 tripartite tricarboxylate transporter substrate binding protein [Roseomonas marmotae]